MSENNEKIYKVVLVGEAGVGKTCIMTRFTKDKFDDEYITSFTAQFLRKTLEFADGKRITFDIWDTAGQEKYMSINKNLFQRVQGIILMYDITEMKSFQNLSVWMNAVEQLSKGTPLILIGNKIDLKDKRQVSSEQGKEYADKYNIEFFESSGKSGENVEKSFIFLGEEIMRKSNVEEKTGGNDYIISKDSTFNKKKKNKKCC